MSTVDDLDTQDDLDDLDDIHLDNLEYDLDRDLSEVWRVPLR